MKRRPDELYEDYRKRRLQEQKRVALYLRGRLWWNAMQLGPYRRPTKKRKEEVNNARISG